MTRRKDHTVRNPLSHAELNVGQKRESDAQRNDDGFHPETLSKFHSQILIRDGMLTTTTKLQIWRAEPKGSGCLASSDWQAEKMER
jgi:hypothetical protein